MAEQLNAEEERLLQSALQTAFSPAPLPQESALPEEPALAPEAEPAPVAPAPDPAAELAPENESAEELWKAEYDAHVEEWRRASAEQRERAEQERARWEEVRAREQALGIAKESLTDDLGAHLRADQERGESGWESVGGSGTGSIVLESVVSVDAGAQGAPAAEPSVADARDLVSGERQGRRTAEELEKILPGSSHAHEKWEDIPEQGLSGSDSLASSYPSLSFPSSSPSGVHPHQPPPHARSHAHPPSARQADRPPAPSTTLAVFDTTLSPRTRVLALLSALAVNVALPFVNGVMLGFGEIFAKEVLVGWFGWGRRAGAGVSRERERTKGAGRREAGLGLHL
ncbi:hypothetical protein WOLCODRAFT_137826 [Wolfiporia cocos MD-104 SS10]|uniref:TOM13-domain-containing protein n=1 Tax=Wolfiporia cocos (strain MD-104) TaxID=742152 RepID=A0A2H3JKA6_WOLCO|nr:hypothetical protein WOLCODRAFT_137826 [Wolfiporia cocos MD-104 SS10]